MLVSRLYSLIQEIFAVETDIRKTSCEDCCMELRLWFPGVPVPSKSTYVWKLKVVTSAPTLTRGILAYTQKSKAIKLAVRLGSVVN